MFKVIAAPPPSPLTLTIKIKVVPFHVTNEHCFSVVLFITLHKMVLAFDFESLCCTGWL